jgi:hypothetical protein
MKVLYQVYGALRSTPNLLFSKYIYIYLGLGSYQLTIKERNSGVGFRGKNRVVKESVSRIVDMNCKGFSNGKSKLL